MDVPDKLLRDLGITDAVESWEVEARARAGPNPELTSTEIDVLRCVSYGLGVKESASVLGRSPHTIKDQLTTARYRLRAKTSGHAACNALRLGLIA